MEIHSLYNLILDRIRGPEHRNQTPAEGEKEAVLPAAQIDRRELSTLMAALREAERLEGRGEPADLARLERLEREISSGAYEINGPGLAEAMLRSPDLSAPGEGGER